MQASLLQGGRLLRGIHRKVDVSEEAMTKAFDLLDRGELGYLTEAQFVEGLNRCLLAFGGTTLPPDFDPAVTVWREASTAGRMSREAFGMVMRRLKMDILLPPAVGKLAGLHSSSSNITVAPGPSGRSPVKPPSLSGFSPSVGSRRQQTMLKNDQLDEEVVLKVFEFTKHQMHKRDILEGDLRSFFVTKHTKDVILKWIMVECHDYTNILRLAVKYSIHNLHLEDVLKLETQKPKVTQTGSNHFLIVPIMRLTRETDKALQAWIAEHHDDVGIDSQGKRKTPFPIMLEEATAGIFSVGPPEHDSTVISIRTTWRSLNNKTGQVKLTTRSNKDPFGGGSRKAATGAGVSSSPEKGKSTSFSFRKASSLGRSASATGGSTGMGMGMRQRSSSSYLGKATPSAPAPSMPAMPPPSPPPQDEEPPQSASFALRDVFGRRRSRTQQQPEGSPAATASNAASSPRTGRSVRSLAASVAEEMGRTLRGALPHGAMGVDKDAEERDDLEEDEWADIFDPDAEDDASVSSLADDDQYFDGQMMREVAESVYHTNGRVVGDTAQWLLHSIMDHTVDRLLPIVECYQIRVSYFQDMLHQRGANFGKKKLKDVMDSKLDLLWLQRRIALLKPMLRHLMRTVGDVDLGLYYQDCDDHLERCLEGLSSLINMSQSIIDEAHHYREERVNEILLLITVLTSIFTPASFIAGVYGMNFRAPDGTPGIGELTWSRGYLWFWLLSGLLSCGMLLCVRYKVGKLGMW